MQHTLLPERMPRHVLTRWALGVMALGIASTASRGQAITDFFQVGHAERNGGDNWSGPFRSTVLDAPYFVGAGGNLVTVANFSWDFGPVDSRTLALTTYGTCHAPSLRLGSQINAMTTMTFAVDRHTSYALRGPMANGADGSSLAIVRVSGVSGTLTGDCVDAGGQIYRIVNGSGIPTSLNVACYGRLTPGTYRIETEGHLGLESLNSRLTFTLCNADVNGQDGVTTQDIFDFLTGWFGGDVIVGNFNGDCCITTQDIFDFLSAWFVGC